MSFRDNLIKARSHLVFLAALGCGLFLVMKLEKLGEPAPDNTGTEIVDSNSLSAESSPMTAFDEITPLPLASVTESSEQDIAHAKIAWRYFENNTNEITGLVNSANQYPSTTMWETGSYFIAVISAELLGLIETSEAEDRLERALNTVAEMRLFDDVLPNKAYNVETGALVDYRNMPSERGLGWSALDIARIIGAFSQVTRHYPDQAALINTILEKWDLDRMVKDGQLIGGNLADSKLRHDQEGRLGYEQYAAKAMMLYGFDMYNAYKAEDNMMVKEAAGHPVPVDKRLHRNITPAFTVSEPYIFDGLEFGFDSRSIRFATAIYKAQEARYLQTGTLTAVSESHLDVEPYFVYSSVWGGGAPWAVMTFKGDRLDSKRTVTTKTAFAWNALFRTDYTQELIDGLQQLGDPERGWLEGMYEIDGTPNSSITTNTNAVVLASLAFKAHGPLIRAQR